MQRLPAKTSVLTGGPNGRNASINGDNNRSAYTGKTVSPIKQLASRIREEQGVEQLKAYLLAMQPFAAPNELKSISEDYGIDYDSIIRSRKANEHDVMNNKPLADAVSALDQKVGKPQESAKKSPSTIQQQMQMLQKIMYLQGLMNGNGFDAGSVINELMKNR